jgi:hypothetical protein
MPGFFSFRRIPLLASAATFFDLKRLFRSGEALHITEGAGPHSAVPDTLTASSRSRHAARG